jgi:hypothetical protein
MSAPESPAKICVVCGEDCSQRQRVRDAQGKYTCKDCVEKRAAAKPAAAAPRTAPAEVDAAMAGFDFEPCPGCGAPLAGKANICMTCGYNKATGKQIKTKVVAAPKGPSISMPKISLGGGTDRPPGIPWDMIFNVVILIAVGLAAWAIASPSGFFPLIVFFSVLYFVWWIGSIVVPFTEGKRGWGMVNILAMCLPVVGIATIYYTFVATETGWLRRASIAVLISLVATGASVGAHGEAATINAFTSDSSGSSQIGNDASDSEP